MGIPPAEKLDRMLDQSKKDVFLSKNAAFLGSILCSLDFEWSAEDWEHEVATDYKKVTWNPRDFLRCDKNERTCTLLHEIWHVARLHDVRLGDRDPKTWNVACDLVIDNSMIRDGYKIPDNGYWAFDLSLPADISEEQVYDMLVKGEVPMPANPRLDLLGPGRGGDKNALLAKQAAMVNVVIRAVQAASQSGQPGTVPGNVRRALDQFLDPVIPWRHVLSQWMTELSEEDYSWKIRDRRFPGVYLPSLVEEHEGLVHLAFFIDTSGSVTDPMIQRFNSEVKYIWENLGARKLTLVQFDTQIHQVRHFAEGDEFVDIEVLGRGGTSMECVADWIDSNLPSGVVVYSDMECDKMRRPKNDVPILWAVAQGSGQPQIPDFGRMICIRDSP